MELNLSNRDLCSTGIFRGLPNPGIGIRVYKHVPEISALRTSSVAALAARSVPPSLSPTAMAVVIMSMLLLVVLAMTTATLLLLLMMMMAMRTVTVMVRASFCSRNSVRTSDVEVWTTTNPTRPGLVI